MRTLKKNLLRKGLFVLISLFALTPLKFKAQQCDILRNRLHCDVRLVVEVYEPDASGACVILCSAYNLLLPPGANIPVNCCPKTCNVRITIIAIGGTPIPPITVDYSTTPPGFLLPVAPPCGPVTGSYTFYLPGQFLIGT